MDDAVASGEYSSPAEAVADALREWKERRENFGYTIAELKREIQKGLDSGPAQPAEPFLGGLVEKYRRSVRGDAAERRIDCRRARRLTSKGSATISRERTLPRLRD